MFDRAASPSTCCSCFQRGIRNENMNKNMMAMLSYNVHAYTSEQNVSDNTFSSMSDNRAQFSKCRKAYIFIHAALLCSPHVQILSSARSNTTRCSCDTGYGEMIVPLFRDILTTKAPILKKALSRITYLPLCLCRFARRLSSRSLAPPFRLVDFNVGAVVVPVVAVHVLLDVIACNVRRRRRRWHRQRRRWWHVADIGLLAR